MYALFSAKERAFWEKRIESAAGESKKCWRTMNKLMCNKSNGKFPDGLTAQAFSRFFAQKIETVLAAIRLLLTLLSLHPVPGFALLNLSSLYPRIKFCF